MTAPQPTCPRFGHCSSEGYSLQTRTQQLAETKAKLVTADERIAELETALHVKTSSVETERLGERITAYQRIEVTVRHENDRLSEENFRLRRLLQTNGYDMLAVDALMADIKVPKDTADTQ